MSFSSEYAAVLAGIQSAVTDALGGPVKQELLEAIRASAQKRVYEAYSASPEAMASRRYEIGDPENMRTAELTHELLRIENKTVMQSGEAGEAAVVEEGMSSYRQPFPRPFMEEALEDYTASGRAEYTLARTLFDHGFDVHFE